MLSSASTVERPVFEFSLSPQSPRIATTVSMRLKLAGTAHAAQANHRTNNKVLIWHWHPCPKTSLLPHY